MSEQNVEIVRKLYEAFGAGELEAMLDLLDPDFESEGGDMERLEGITVRGRKDAEGWFESISEVWETVHPQVDEFNAVDEHRVLVVLRLRVTGKGSGIDVEEPAAHLWTVRDGKAVRLDVYSTKSEALEALGLQQ